MENQAIDALYGLEPLFEPGDADVVSATDFIGVQCPHCGEGFDVALDLSAGSCSYVEDCQVCCQPIELAVRVDDAGALIAVGTARVG